MNYPYNNNAYQYAEAYKQAERQVRAKVDFYWHLAVYLVINSFLFGIYLENSLTMNWFGYPWFLWPLAGWGIAIVLNFLRVFVLPGRPSRRQQMIDREVARQLERMNYPAPTTNPPYMVQPPLATDQTNNHNHTKEEIMAIKRNQGQG